MNLVENLSIKLIKNYLDCIRHNGSQVSIVDRGLFPHYWFYPYQITVFRNGFDDIAIQLKREVSGKSDKISVKEVKDRIEKSVLPSLAYERNPMFKISDYVHDSSVQSLTLNLNGITPAVALGFGCEFRLMEVRVEAKAKEYPLEFELLWFLTSPNTRYFTIENAQSKADADFWGKIHFNHRNERHF